MTLKHLDERSVYEEHYDRHTIEECRFIEDFFLSPEMQSKHLPDGRGFPDRIMPIQIFQITGERYLEREKTINQWMERDRQRDMLVEQARPPLIRCPSCGQAMECLYSHLHLSFTNNEPDKMEFFLACKPCQQSRKVYENGREIIRDPILCEKCHREVELSSEEREGKHYNLSTCTHCGHREETLSVLDEEKKEPTQEEIERFERDKQRFCISEEQSKRYVDLMKRIKGFEKQKEQHLLDMDLYDQLKETKKLTIAALEQLLIKALKKADFADLRISMSPDRGITLDFSVRDLKVDREEIESKRALEKAINDVVCDTNWELSEYVNYRLGFLSGHIRGYESQPDLEKLVRSRMKKPRKNKTKVA